jgi:hypothetical protein
MSLIAISFAWVVVGVVPVDAAVPDEAALAATASNGTAEAAPLTSRTVNAIAEDAGAVPPTVTVTD